MKERTKTELKTIMQRALHREYGFEPKLKDITLLESNGDGTYILADVGCHIYRFDSRTLIDGSVCIGRGTIEKEC